MKITVIGLGYVGLSNAILLAKKNNVIAYDLDEKKVDIINSKKSPIHDELISDYLVNKKLNFTATSNKENIYKDSDFVIIATPTDYDYRSKKFNTQSVEDAISDVLKANSSAFIVIKSTIPLGFTKMMQKRFLTKNIIFSPEFLREGSALLDNLYPSRIIVGDKSKKAKIFANLMSECALKENINILLTKSSEAEAIKLFSNTYLAMRVAFFNELDTFAEVKELNTKHIIEGICLDERIGSHYNNPSFGYGGYCLPKDTKQLLASYNNVSNELISAIVKSNSTRKDFIIESIMARKPSPKLIGIHRLVMKSNSDNFRSSAIIDIIKRLKSRGLKLVIYEPNLSSETFLNCKVIKDLKKFKATSHVIIANRKSKSLTDVSSKVYSRDIFGSDK